MNAWLPQASYPTPQQAMVFQINSYSVKFRQPCKPSHRHDQYSLSSVQFSAAQQKRVGALMAHHPAWMSHHTGGSRQGHPRYTGAHTVGRPWVARSADQSAAARPTQKPKVVLTGLWAQDDRAQTIDEQWTTSSTKRPTRTSSSTRSVEWTIRSVRRARPTTSLTWRVSRTTRSKRRAWGA